MIVLNVASRMVRVVLFSGVVYGMVIGCGQIYAFFDKYNTNATRKPCCRKETA